MHTEYPVWKEEYIKQYIKDQIADQYAIDLLALTRRKQSFDTLIHVILTTYQYRQHQKRKKTLHDLWFMIADFGFKW